MALISLICYVVALVLFAVAAFGVGLPRIHLGWLAAAFFTLAVLLGHVPGLA